jgi:hypothetical protein
MTIMDGVHSPMSNNNRQLQHPMLFQMSNNKNTISSGLYQNDRTSIKENPLECSLNQKGSARYHYNN